VAGPKARPAEKRKWTFRDPDAPTAKAIEVKTEPTAVAKLLSLVAEPKVRPKGSVVETLSKLNRINWNQLAKSVATTTPQTKLLRVGKCTTKGWGPVPPKHPPPPKAKTAMVKTSKNPPPAPPPKAYRLQLHPQLASGSSASGSGKGSPNVEPLRAAFRQRMQRKWTDPGMGPTEFAPSAGYADDDQKVLLSFRVSHCVFESVYEVVDLISICGFLDFVFSL